MDDRSGDSGDSESRSPDRPPGAPAGGPDSAAPVPSLAPGDAPTTPPIVGWDTGVQWEAVDAAAAAAKQRHPLDVGSAVARTLDLFLAHPLVFVVLAVPGAIVSGVVGALSPTPPVNTWVLLLAALVVVVIGLVLGLAMIIAADELRAGRPVGIGSVVRRALGFTIRAVLSALAQWLVLFGLILVASILVAIVVFTRSVPLVVVGIIVLLVLVFYVALRWSLSNAAIALEGTGPIEALGRSRFLTQGTMLRIIGVFLALFVVVAPLTIGVSFLSIIAAGALPAVVLTAAIGLITAPLFSIASATVFGDLTGRPVVPPTPAPEPRARSIFAAILVVLGVFTLAVAIPQLGPAFDRLALNRVPVADRGRLLTGTTRNPVDPCHPLDVNTTFTSADSIYVGGYFTKPIPGGATATIDVYVNGNVVNTAHLGSASAIACYYEASPIVGGSPGTYRLVITLAQETIAEGTFTIR